MIDAQTNISKTKTRVLNTILILVGGALFLVLLLRSRLVYSPVLDVTKSYDALISIGSKTIPVTIADTEEERNLGPLLILLNNQQKKNQLVLPILELIL
jgi:thiamine biosynthesis protein ThiC